MFWKKPFMGYFFLRKTKKSKEFLYVLLYTRELARLPRPKIICKAETCLTLYNSDIFFKKQEELYLLKYDFFVHDIYLLLDKAEPFILFSVLFSKCLSPFLGILTNVMTRSLNQ